MKAKLIDPDGIPNNGDEYRRGHHKKRRKKKPPLGSGKRFDQLSHALAKRPGVKNPGALAAYIGRKKYGKAGFQKLSQHGR